MIKKLMDSKRDIPKHQTIFGHRVARPLCTLALAEDRAATHERCNHHYTRLTVITIMTMMYVS